jgi:hypothetical protein
MDQNDWQYSTTNSQQHRQRMPDTPPHQNVRRYSHQPIQAPQQSPKQVQQQQLPQNTTSSQQYSYAAPTRSTASPSSRHSITSDFSTINIRDDSVGGATVEKSGRPNLSVHPSGLRPNNQGSVPSSPTRQSATYNTAGGYPPPPGLGRTTSDEMRHYQSSNSRHSSPMLTASPSMSPYYSTTPHLLNSINEREQTMSWNQVPTQARTSPSRPAYAFPPPGRDSVSPRSHLHSQPSPISNRHSIPHVPSNYDSKAQFSPRQATHFPGTAIATSPNISPTNFSPRHAAFGMNRDPGSMMSDIVYSNPPLAKFRIIGSPSELTPTVNAQPKYRRANPDGGFISVRPLLMTLIIASCCVDDASADNIPIV